MTAQGSTDPSVDLIRMFTNLCKCCISQGAVSLSTSLEHGPELQQYRHKIRNSNECCRMEEYVGCYLNHVMMKRLNLVTAF